MLQKLVLKNVTPGSLIICNNEGTELVISQKKCRTDYLTGNVYTISYIRVFYGELKLKSYHYDPDLGNKNNPYTYDCLR